MITLAENAVAPFKSALPLAVEPAEGLIHFLAVAGGVLRSYGNNHRFTPGIAVDQ